VARKAYRNPHHPGCGFFIMPQPERVKGDIINAYKVWDGKSNGKI
jgi:hypothetical protein